MQSKYLNPNSSNKYSTIQSQCGLQQGFVFSADPETNGFILVQDGSELMANDIATNPTDGAFVKGRLRLAIMIQLPDNDPTNDSKYMVVDLAVLNQGADLSSYQGVNTYEATYNADGSWTMYVPGIVSTS